MLPQRWVGGELGASHAPICHGPIPFHVMCFIVSPIPLQGRAHYPEGSPMGMGVVRPQTPPPQLLNSVVWEMGIGESPAALHEKGAPIRPSLPPESLCLVCPGCPCVGHSLEFRGPEPVLHFQASLRVSLTPPGLPGTGASWVKAIGSSASQSIPPLPGLPHTPPPCPPWFFHFSLLLPVLPLPLTFVPTSHHFSTFLPSPSLTWLLCCDIYFCIISFFLW